MATSNGLIGNFRGKLGNIVGYQYIDANGHAVQAIRAYRPDVFNPKTLDQAQQRIKITNSVAFYKAYASLLSRSYEGRKNAHACYCRQQSLAMSMIYGETPAVPKGRRGFVPAFYIVAEGSLPERSVLSVGTADAPQSFTTSLQVSITIDNATTLGELSQNLIDNNLNIVDGDTLYFMYAVQVGSIYYNPAIVTLTLDTASSTPLVSVLSPVDQLQSVTDDSNILRLGYRSIAAYRMSQPLAGAALIQSRGSGSSHLNYSWSSSMMLPSDTVIASWYSQEAFDQAIPSYLPPIPAPSDLTLNQSGTNSGYKPEPPEPPLLPYKHRLEYIQSTGQQLIDTDIVPDNYPNLVCTAKYRFDAYKLSGGLFGNYDSSEDDSVFRVIQAATNDNLGWASANGKAGGASVSIATNIGVIFSSLLSAVRHSVTINGVTTSIPINSGIKKNKKLSIFSGRNPQHVDPYGRACIATLWSLQLFSDESVLLRDFIPVIDNSDVVCLYDNVTQQCFYNLGTEPFIAGPIID